MLNIDFITLIKAAPFPEEQRNKILVDLDRLTDDQKYKLTSVAWIGLSRTFFSHLKYECDKILLEVRESKRAYNSKDFQEVEVRLTQEYVSKLKMAQTNESLTDIRAKLRAFFIRKN